MGIWKMATLSWEAVAALDPARAVAILPTGAIEAHGPHLPLETDVIIAEAMARAAAEQLVGGDPVAGPGPADELDVLLLPALTYSPAPFARGFPGTISIRPETLTDLVIDIGRSLATTGVGTLAVANAHLDPAHLRALHAAGEALAADGGIRTRWVFPDITRRALADRLGAEFRSGACHAGRFETSIVLAERPELVDDQGRRGLPPVDRSLSVAIREGKRSFEEVGGDRAYFGDPAAASAEEGAERVAELGQILAEPVWAALNGAA